MVTPDLAWAQALKPDLKWARRELQKMKLPPGFIKEALETYEPDGFQTVLKLNVLGFLKPPQHMDRVTPQSVTEAEQFLKDNQSIFRRAEKKHKVPAAVVSALLWIETRHGEDRGQYHVLSVYMHLLQAERVSIRKELTEMANQQNQEKQAYQPKEIKKIVREKVTKRSDWAREQLQALAEIQKTKKVDLKTLRGSFAGAFGLPQFIPSSYRDFAQSAKPQKTPVLTQKDDAIMSVAYYLSKHGWKKRSPEAQISALMKYNNSRDYAESILEIAGRVSSSGPHD